MDSVQRKFSIKSYFCFQMFIPFRFEKAVDKLRPRKSKRMKLEARDANSKLVERVEEGINKYLRQEFFPTLEKHLFGEVEIRIREGQVMQEDLIKVEELKSDMENLDISKRINEVFESSVNDEEGLEDSMKKAMMDVSQVYLVTLDKLVEEELVKEMRKRQEKKCGQRPGVFNFSTEQLTLEQEELLAKGKNCVMRVNDPPAETLRTVCSEIALYLEKYCEKFKLDLPREFIKGAKCVPRLSQWLANVEGDVGLPPEHGLFFGRLRQTIEAAATEVNRSTPVKASVYSSKELESKVTFSNSMVVGELNIG